MKNVVICGVGGQGVILASKILIEVAMQAGYDVKESEVHGMAQRGGSVDCQVRFGEKVYSPLIDKGKADFILGFETLEGMRKLDYLAPDGTFISNLYKIEPVPVKIGAIEYPADIETWISKNIPSHKLVRIEDIQKNVGSKKPINVVLIGILSQYLEFSEEVWLKAIKSLVKEKFIEMNIKAFQYGRSV